MTFGKADPSSPAHDGSIRVLLIEDDARLAQLTQKYLESHGMSVAVEGSGRRGLEQALLTRPDLVLLDLMLPELDGIEVCRQLRARCSVPVIMLTARIDESDRVLGLEIGADDYLTKPFSPRELEARIRAQVRRARGLAGPSDQPIRVGRLYLDPRSLLASLGEQRLVLTSYEFALLRVLAERAGQVLSREQLIDLVRGSAEEAFDRSIDVHISRLRQKLGDDSRDPKLLKTVRGVGYLYAAPGPDDAGR